MTKRSAAALSLGPHPLYITLHHLSNDARSFRVLTLEKTHVISVILNDLCPASSLPNLRSVETLVDRLASAPCFRVSKPSPLQSTVKPGYTGVPCTGSLVIPDRNCDLAFFCMGIPESLFIMEYWTVLKSFCSSPVYLVEYNYDVTSL